MLFVWLWALAGGRSAPDRRGPPESSSPLLPTSGPPPWPQVVPSGLPPFPGSGWEYDEPPPPAVQQRAGQLVSQLWGQGRGAYRIEQTAGRWIAYQAAIVASGKRGVVAFREKRRATAPTTAAVVPSSPAQRAPAPPPPAPRVAPASPLGLPTLRYGVGLNPAPPSADVRLLQQRLGVVPADGRFGTGTLAAVKAYQRAQGIDDDGVVGRQTWTRLFATAAA